jgi:hypothetical protein
MQSLTPALKRKVNASFRAKDDSHLWPICGAFNVTERAIRRLRDWERACGYFDDVESYRASFPAMIGYVLAALWAGYRFIRIHKPDVIHAHFAVPAGGVAFVLSILSGIPYILTAHLGDVPGGVPGDVERFKRNAQPRHFEAIALAKPPVELRGHLSRGTERGAFPPGGQRRQSTDMVGVVVRGEHRREREAVAREMVLHRLRLTRIHGDGMAVALQNPDVIVLEGADRAYRQHAASLLEWGHADQYAPGVVRHAARAVPPREGAGVPG